MRREKRGMQRDNSFKNLLFIYGGTILVLVITCLVVYAVYNNKLKKTAESMLSAEKITALVPNTSSLDVEKEVIEEASTDLSKSIEEVKNEIEDVSSQEDTENNTNEVTGQVEEKAEEVSETAVPEKKELSFIYPVEGEIIKDFAKDNLVFSETLQEWTTHNGIDIRAERATVVKASEDGVISAIKNDPRYGLTVIIEHEDGYKTIYSNLLTAEFVIEDEEVTKGQTIGTVGNSAVFEIADEAHLHFELLKDNEYLDPKAYLK